jgi:hypothetical protein
MSIIYDDTAKNHCYNCKYEKILAKPYKKCFNVGLLNRWITTAGGDIRIPCPIYETIDEGDITNIDDVLGKNPDYSYFDETELKLLREFKEDYLANNQKEAIK